MRHLVTTDTIDLDCSAGSESRRMSDRFKNQNYDKLVKHHRALGVPWTDPTFPPSDASVGAAKVRELGRKVEWKRPSVSAMFS